MAISLCFVLNAQQDLSYFCTTIGMECTHPILQGMPCMSVERTLYMLPRAPVHGIGHHSLRTHSLNSSYCCWHPPRRWLNLQATKVDVFRTFLQRQPAPGVQLMSATSKMSDNDCCITCSQWTMYDHILDALWFLACCVFGGCCSMSPFSVRKHCALSSGVFSSILASWGPVPVLIYHLLHAAIFHQPASMHQPSSALAQTLEQTPWTLTTALTLGDPRYKGTVLDT